MNKKSFHISGKKFIEYIILSLILILGFCLRLYKLNNPIADWHSWRQADTASVTRNYMQDGINLLFPRFHDISSIQSGIFNPKGYRMVEFPVYNAVVAVISERFTSLSMEEWSRIVTAFCAVLSALFLYLLGKRFLGTIGGLLSSFYYLVIPYNIFFTRVILPDPMGVTFGLISLWLFVKFYDDKGVYNLFLSAVFFALMLLIKPYLGFYIFPIIYLTIEKYGIKTIFSNIFLRRKFAFYFIIAVAPFVFWRLWESNYPEGIPFYKWAFNGSGIRFHPAYWNWIFAERLGHLILGSMGVVPFVFGVFNPKLNKQFINWFLAGALFYVVLVASANVMHDYYQILTIPAIALTLASGSVYLLNQKIFNRILAVGFLGFSVMIMIISGWYQIKGDYNINHPEIMEAGTEIDKIAPKDALVVASYNGDTAFLYQTKRSGWPAVDDSIDNIIKRGADYYVSVDLNNTDTKNFEKRFTTVIKTEKYIILDLHKPLNTTK